jgi:hypothetical protein
MTGRDARRWNRISAFVVVHQYMADATEPIELIIFSDYV